MASETHELRLKINAGAAKSGAREFTGAIASIKKAVRDLDRDSAGAFTKLRNVSPKIDVTPLTRARNETEKLAAAQTATERAATKMAAQLRTTAIASSNALRVSTDQASRLRDRLLSIGDTAGLARLEQGLNSLKVSLTNATTGLDVREARAGYADLASELNRTAREAERVRAIMNASARAEQDAATSAADHSRNLENLRAKYDSTYRISKQYEAQLADIQTLENAGAITASRAATAREQAAASLMAAGNAAAVYSAKARVSGHETAYMASQFNDIGVMLASGQSPLILAVQQGTQISQMLNQMGDRASILATLRSGFMSMINPVSLATIGIIAGGAALAQFAIDAFGAESAADAFKRQLGQLSTMSNDLSKNFNILEMDALQLAETYGTAAIRVREFAKAQAELRMGEIREALSEQHHALEEVAGSYYTAASGGHNLRNTLNRLGREFDLNTARAKEFNELLLQLDRATTFDDQRAALKDILQFTKDSGIALKDFPAPLRTSVIQMIELSNEADALSALMDRTSNAIDGSIGQTNAWASAMTGVRAEIDAIASSLSNIGGGIISNAAKGAELDALRAGKSVREAAVARQRYQKEAEFAAREQSAGSGVGGFFQRQMIDAERFQYEEGLRLDAELDAARTAARKATSSSRDGGRVERLGDETRQLERLIEQTNNRTFSINQENDALRLLVDGQAQTMEGARLLAAAQAAGMSATDSATLSMVKQHEAAIALNEELQRLARDPVKDWMDSVPTWVEAGRQIEAQVFDSLSSAVANFAMTGKLDFESFGQSILSTATRIIADIAVQELIGLFTGGGLSSGGGGGFNLTSLVGSFFAAEGGLTSSPAAVNAGPAVSPTVFRHAPQYAEGTTNTSGIPAILHPNEAVIPLSKGRKIPVEMPGDGVGGGGTIINMPQTFNVTTPDADSFRRSQKQIAADAARAGRMASAQND